MAAIECEGGKFKSRTSQGRKVKDGGERSRHAYLLEVKNDKVLGSASQPGFTIHGFRMPRQKLGQSRSWNYKGGPEATCLRSSGSQRFGGGGRVYDDKNKRSPG
jgi:hypothetical protein